jgi:hypothetical protein
MAWHCAQCSRARLNPRRVSGCARAGPLNRSMTGAIIREILDVIMPRHQRLKDSRRHGSPEATREGPRAIELRGAIRQGMFRPAEIAPPLSDPGAGRAHSPAVHGRPPVIIPALDSAFAGAVRPGHDRGDGVRHTPLAFRRGSVSEIIDQGAAQSRTIEMVTIDPLDLQAAQQRDAATHERLAKR